MSAATAHGTPEPDLLIGEAFGMRASDFDRLFAGCFLVAPSSIVAASLAVLLGVAACRRP